MFTVIRGGCFSKHPSNFIMQRPNGLPHYLFLVIKTGSELTIDGKIRTCRPNSVLIIRPNTPYSYRNPNGEYIDDWLHFDCLPEDLSMLDTAMFHQGLPVSNPGILTAYIQQILWEHNFAAENSKEYYIDTLFKILLRHLCNDFHAENTGEYSLIA